MVGCSIASKGGYMKKAIFLFIIFFLLIILYIPNKAVAGCKSDCRDEYESEVDSCKMLYDDPDDADMLQMCIDNAKSEYESCIDECEN
jgi:hypothetical protein